MTSLGIVFAKVTFAEVFTDIANFSHMITHVRPPFVLYTFRIKKVLGAFLKDSAPPKLPIRYCLSSVSPKKLEITVVKRGVALATPQRPKPLLQSLPLTLRRTPVIPIPNCSKASGVFSSSCRKAASSPPLYFHRANPRDSSQVVIPFVRV